MPTTVTNAVSWRSEGIKYRKNEVFLDVIESVNLLVGTPCFRSVCCLKNSSHSACKLPPCLRHNISYVIRLYFLWAAFFKWLILSFLSLFTFQVSANGNVLRSEIVGSIKMRVFLSGMPELRLGLNDKVLFENTGSEFIL